MEHVSFCLQARIAISEHGSSESQERDSQLKVEDRNTYISLSDIRSAVPLVGTLGRTF